MKLINLPPNPGVDPGFNKGGAKLTQWRRMRRLSSWTRISCTTVVVHNRDRPCFAKPLIEHPLKQQQGRCQQTQQKP